MPQTYLESLLTRRLKVSQELEALEKGKSGGSPDMSGSGEVKHDAYLQTLLAREKQINELIDEEQARVDGPVEIQTQGWIG